MPSNKPSSSFGIPEIVPYRGYASKEKLYLKGRVLLSKDIVKGHSHSRLRNIIDTFRRFRSTKLPNTEIELVFQNLSVRTKTDREGYFTFEKSLSNIQESTQPLWSQVELKLFAEKFEGHQTCTSEVMIPDAQASFGIISDIDDTVLKSHMGSWFKLRMLYATFVKDGFQRKPMEGIVEVFNKLILGKAGKAINPIFYVSHSPWNLYDMLEEFMEFQNLPKGPILLRDFGINPVESFSGHKIASITHIFEMYPSMPFILFGDTASKDADYYLQLAKMFPDRVKAIFIRFTDETSNARRVEKLINKSKLVPSFIIRSSKEIINHAKELGLI